MSLTELSLRHERCELPARSTTPVRLLHAEAASATWRLVHVFSEVGRAFEVSLSWSVAGAQGMSARVTVPTATRICVFARSIQVDVLSLSDDKNPVAVAIADGFMLTSNVYEVDTFFDATSGGIEPFPGEVEGARQVVVATPIQVPAATPANETVLPAGMDVPVPGFARSVRVELSDPEQVTTTTVLLVNGRGEVTSSSRVSEMPEFGLLLGATCKVRVCPPVSIGLRVIYLLSV